MQGKNKAAFAFWEGRIAPVFDVARQVLLVEKAPVIVGTAGTDSEQRPVLALPEAPALKAGVLKEQRVSVLVCGAISRPLQESIVRQGIRVLPFIMGEVEELIRAWRTDRLEQDGFLMPGCRGRRMGRPNGRQGGTPGGRRGQGKGGGYQGGTWRARGTPDMEQACVCPGCGYRTPHTQGMPCVQLRCPHCHTVLVRAR